MSCLSALRTRTAAAEGGSCGGHVVVYMFVCVFVCSLPYVHDHDMIMFLAWHVSELSAQKT